MSHNEKSDATEISMAVKFIACSSLHRVQLDDVQSPNQKYITEGNCYFSFYRQESTFSFIDPLKVMLIIDSNRERLRFFLRKAILRSFILFFTYQNIEFIAAYLSHWCETPYFVVMGHMAHFQHQIMVQNESPMRSATPPPRCKNFRV